MYIAYTGKDVFLFWRLFYREYLPQHLFFFFDGMKHAYACFCVYACVCTTLGAP